VSALDDCSSKARNLVLALIIAASVSLLALTGLFRPVEDALTSMRAQALSRPPTGQIAIVDIDAHSLAELRTWPWPRTYHAALVRRLHISGASMIAFDVDFSARSNDGDKALSSAIHEAGQVILPIFVQKETSNGQEVRLLASRPDAAFRDAWVGGVNIFPDSDGVVREYPAATFINGSVQPSIATLLAEQSGLGDRSFEPDWGIDVRSIRHYSFADVMNGVVPARVLRGKRVLIGATAIELGDRYAVPRYGVLPGVVIQALAADSLLQGRAMMRTGLAVTLAGILAIALLLAPRPLRRPFRYATLCSAVAIIVVAGPIFVECFWPLSVTSSPWILTLFVSIGTQAGVEAKRRLRFRAHFDADSGLPNRSMLEKSLGSSSATNLILATASIERFETIRDGLGLSSTNEMIGEAAERIRSLIGGAVYRIAPDVIAWVQPGAVDMQACIRRIRGAFRDPIVTASGAVDVALTVGLERHDGPRRAVLCIEHALAAIGTARSTGTDHAWHRASEPQIRRQLSMTGELRKAIQNGSLRLVYQPKLSLRTATITDSEALVRWHDGNRIVPPDEFIPLAEQTGFIREITDFALRSALANLSKWAQNGLPMRVAVNVSATDLTSTDFADQVSRLLSEAGVPPSQLVLEITESALIRSPAEAIATLSELRATGIRLAVDDYGTGQSTLSYLKHLPVHELKIDKSFVTDLHDNTSDQILVRSTIDLAHELGLVVVAEGVEDQRCLDILRDLGCDYAQGYFIGKPLLPDDLFEMALLSKTVSSPRKIDKKRAA
jgi:EAL domain-containing protein (putative c-di-GMP-specific phosphodiesterase class I)/CHASE2 domain-containing sensor protein